MCVSCINIFNSKGIGSYTTPKVKTPNNPKLECMLKISRDHSRDHRESAQKVGISQPRVIYYLYNRRIINALTKVSDLSLQANNY